jgi:hypothetical protein
MTINPFLDRDDLLTKIRAAFVARDSHYPDRRAALKGQLKPLADRLDQLQKQGHPMVCAEQILLEAQWLSNYRDDWDRAAQRIADLTQAVAKPDDDRPMQDDEGSWGCCCKAWYRKLEPTIDALQGELPGALKPLQFMQSLADAGRMLDYLYRLQISDIAATGENHRDELAAVQSALSQLIFKDQLRELLASRPELGFSVTRELEAYYSDYLDQTQHPRTGYWGPWYRFDGRLVPVQDLSFTFHVISYRSGNIANWPLVIDSTLAIKNLVYPAGWQPDAQTQYNNHNNYDVLTVFYYGWPHMTAEQKKNARGEIAAMLNWCLASSLPDMSAGETTGSMLDAYYFGVRFLDRAGFWDPAKRFWLHRPPDLPAGMPVPYDLARRLQAGFAQLHDTSEEADTVRDLLRTAVCMSTPAEA